MIATHQCLRRLQLQLQSLLPHPLVGSLALRLPRIQKTVDLETTTLEVLQSASVHRERYELRGSATRTEARK